MIHQTNYLLDQQIEALEKQFVEEGGYSETLAAKGLEHRQHNATTKDNAFPPCPECNSPMVQRTAKTGAHTGEPFLGCTRYPTCKGTRKL